MSDTIIKIISISLPSVVAVLTVFLTNYFNGLSTNREVLQNRINAVYKPFYLEYFKYKTNHSIWQQDEIIINIGKIYQICLENIDCLETDTQSITIQLASELSIYTSDDDRYFGIIEDDFHVLVYKMFKEYSKICHKLKLPKPLLPL